MAIQESGEDYLETILILREKNNLVRAIDIANEMGYSKPSVSRAMSILKKEGYININESNYISLTESGEEKARGVYEKHRLLTRFFESLGVDHETAVNDACRIEHVISPITFEKIKQHFFLVK
ncbi:MAG: metal-dependent transcriptional regulator [Firmicutes bacterium]|nr:metal-dependent transcriptional regulator [Bacillota bacterium]